MTIQSFIDRAHLGLAHFMRIFTVGMMLLFVAGAANLAWRQLPLFAGFCLLNAGMLWFAKRYLDRWIRFKKTVIIPGERWRTRRGNEPATVVVIEVDEDFVAYEVASGWPLHRSGLGRWDFLLLFYRVRH